MEHVFLHRDRVRNVRLRDTRPAGYWHRMSLVGVLAILSASLLVPGLAFADTTDTPHGGYTTGTKKCEKCHTLHEAKADQLLPVAPAQAVCYTCHDGTDATDVRDDFGETTESAALVKSRHPVPEGRVLCADCHTPHRGPAEGNPRSLSAGSAEATSGVEFCGACHGPGSALPGGDLVSDFQGSGHDLALQPPSGTDIPCASCHEPHGSTNLALIRTQIVDSTGTTRSVEVTSSFNPLCLQCHGTPVGTFPGTPVFGMTSHSSVTTSTKAAVVFPSTKAQPGDCANCHDPHGSGGRPQYLRASGNQLCYSCHDAAGTSKPNAYSYQGSASFSRASHNDVTGTVTNVLNSQSEGFAAWESTTLPTPAVPGAAIPAARIASLATADGNYTRTALADITGQSDYQLYRFLLPDGATGLQSLGATWLGYGSEVAGYPVTVSLWDNVAGAWVPFAQAMAASPSTFSTATITPARFVDAGNHVWLLTEAKKAVDAQLVTTPTVSALAGGDVRVTWNTLGRSTSWVDFDSDGPPYASSAGDDSLVTTHTVTFTPPAPSGVIRYRVRSADPSGLTRTTEDTAVGVPAPVISPIGTVKNTGNAQTTVPVPVSWTMADSARAPYAYQLSITGTRTNGQAFSYVSPSWLTTTTATVSVPFGTYEARVVGRDKDGVLTVSSVPDAFSAVFEYIAGGSCPFLFSWDGVKYQFESDNFTAGRIGGTVSGGYQQPNPNDAYVVSTPVTTTPTGNLEFKLVEERYEVDYLDFYKLYAIDEPAGAKVFAEKAVAGRRTFPPLQSALHTTRNLHAPASVSRTDTGADVLDAVASQDGTLVALNEDAETTFTYKTLEVDLGADAQTAPQVKVVMDAISEFPVTQEGIARRATFGLPQELEVQDTDGTWRSIVPSANPLPTPPEFSRPYIFDLTSAVQGTTGKVRFTFLFRTLIDYIAVDTTQDEWITVSEVPALSANLGYHGVDLETGSEMTAAFDYGVGVSAGSYYSGSYTRYGDVGPLLGAIDDKFVIMGQGDELSLSYQPLPDPAEGLTRQYVFSAYGYYKDRKTDLPAEVEPLPFAAMSNYPYPAEESYPADAEHDAYRAEYNTRVVNPLISSAASEPADRPMQLAAASWAPHRSVNTDVVRLDVTYSGGATGSCGTCHAVHGATDASGTVLPALTVAPESSTCLGNGTLACHGGPNSASGTNIAASLTASSAPNTHHDLLPDQMAASGSKMACSDCHNPHSDNPSSPFKNPDSIGTTMTSGIADYVDGNGDFYALVGSQHDGVEPIISSFALDVASQPATSPAFTWLTNEKATSRVDLGITPLYEIGSYGTDALSTNHSVVTSDLVLGQTYHFRVRSADAMGNTSVSQDATFMPMVAPATPALNPAPSGYEWTDYTFTWGSVTSVDGDPVEYQAELTNGVTTYNYGWSTDPSWAVTGLAYGDWNWRVRSRDAGHTFAVSAWSGWSAFSNYTPSSTCPYLFTWDGTSYGFETDLYGQGKLAIPRATGFAKPQPNEAYVLQNDPVVKDGFLDFRMVEERPEVDYMDGWALYSADVPDGYELFTERPAQGGSEYTTVTAEVHTARTDAPAPLSATWVNTGQDVLAAISSSDEQRLLLNPERNTTFDYQTIELDLAHALGAPQTKLLIDAQTMFPNSPEGYARAGTFSYRTKIEVQDDAGTWVSVPATQAILAPPAEFYRPLALDITNVWQSSSRKLRLTFLYKTYIDSIRVDTSQDVPVNLVELPLQSATLQWHGQDSVTGPGDFYEYIYGEPNSWTSYFPGNYTKFGDVTPLLATAGDDKYVIFGGGDEITAQFVPPAQPAATGTQRKYVVLVDGWYKDPNSQCPKTVDPLPFHAMSTFPYPPTEQYPTDAEHQQYLADWNTRYQATVQPAPAAPAAPAPAPDTFLQKLENLFSFLMPDASEPSQPPASASVADARGDYGLTFTRGMQEEVRGLFSVDTDAALIRRVRIDGSTVSVPVVEGWESTGATPTLAAKGSAAGSGFSNATTVDGSYWRTDLASADRAWNFQVMRVRLTPEEVGSSRELSFQWTGHGEATEGYPTFASIWNFSTGQWEQILSPRDAGSDVTAAKSVAQTNATFCLTCHDGTPPAGVTVPASVPNIGANWSGAPGDDFHSGVASSGWGGGLKSPYSRGQEVACSACHLSHGGTNPYHIPGTVNGTSGIAVTNGNNIQQLCAACHTGTVEQYHQGCYDCHWYYNDTSGYGHDMRGKGPTASDNCLSCHGHGKTWQHQPYTEEGCWTEPCHGAPENPAWSRVYPTM